MQFLCNIIAFVLIKVKKMRFKFVFGEKIVLANDPDFQDTYVDEMFFGEDDE